MNILPQYSPSNSKQLKNRRMLHCCDQMLSKIDIRDISNISNNHLTYVETINHSQLQQRITTTAKTIIYLFSQEIDLIENIENDIHNYDKYQKTRLILKELVNSIFQGRMEMDIEALKASQEMGKMEIQLLNIKKVVEGLQIECLQKDRQIDKYKKTIVQLTKGYEEAKQFYEQELLQLKFQSQQLRINLNKAKNYQKKTTKSVHNGKQYNVYIRLPKQEKSKQTQRYTDRSMYQRFSAQNLVQSEDVLTSINKERNMKGPPQVSNNFTHVIASHTIQLQRDALQRKLSIIQEEYRLLSTEHLRQIQRLNHRIQELQSKIQINCNQIRLKQLKVAQKNTIINELLQIIEKSS